MFDVSSLLKELINLPSPSGAEKEVGTFIQGYLQNNGLTSETIPVDEGGFNVVVRVGKPRVYLSSHIDVVPNPMPFSEDGEYIYGRGACDAKGSVAAMMTAAILAKQEAVTDFGLIFTVGEETDFRGVKKVAVPGFEIPFVVVGEPTGMKIVNGHYGFQELRVRVEGKAAHTSNPELGDNAIDKLLVALGKLAALKVHPETSMTLAQIAGGTASNVVPDLAEAVYSFRVSPEDRTDYLDEFRQLVPGGVQIVSGDSLDAVKTDIPEFMSSFEIQGVTKYTTELSFYKRGVVIGPGDITVAHTDQEKVAKSQLNSAVEMYGKILRETPRIEMV